MLENTFRRYWRGQGGSSDRGLAHHSPTTVRHYDTDWWDEAVDNAHTIERKPVKGRELSPVLSLSLNYE